MTLAPGFGVGHWTGAGTGVTVVLCPDGTIGSGEIRGGAPASRETALLEPGRTIEPVDAVVLSGSSAFGLAAADGVMQWLVEHDRGFPTHACRVPIVPAAAIYDLGVAGDERVTSRCGYDAADAAGRDEGTERGRVGAGRGATVGKWRGPEHATDGGLGVATTTLDGVMVGALALVNAVGDVVDADGSVLAGSSAPPDVEPFPSDPGFADLDVGEATTLVVIATDATLSRTECFLLAQTGHLGIAHAVMPSHTRFDGDFVIALAGGSVPAPNLDRLRVVVDGLVAEAVRDAVRHHDG